MIWELRNLLFRMESINIYSDESRHRAERFLLLGGLWIRAQDIDYVETELNKIRNKFGYRTDWLFPESPVSGEGRETSES